MATKRTTVKRKPIPRQIQAQVLFGANHTCCICRLGGKDVQIHHIDGDHSSIEEKNLAVVCLDCHSKVSGPRGLGRSYTPLEVQKYKLSWEKWLHLDRDQHSLDYPQRVAARLTRTDSPGQAQSAAHCGLLIPNPFRTYGRVTDPDHFIGRVAILRELIADVHRGISRALIGEAQIGKSSILTMIRERKNQIGFTRQQVIHLDLQILNDAKDFFTALCTEIGIPACQGYALKLALAGRRYLLCLDEVEKLTSDKFGVEIRDQIRALSDGMDAPLTVVVASRLPLEHLFPERLGMTSPLYNICVPLVIPPFTIHECRDLVKTRLTGTGFLFSESQISDIYTRSKGNPGSILQEAAILFHGEFADA